MNDDEFTILAVIDRPLHTRLQIQSTEKYSHCVLNILSVLVVVGEGSIVAESCVGKKCNIGKTELEL